MLGADRKRQHHSARERVRPITQQFPQTAVDEPSAFIRVGDPYDIVVPVLGPPCSIACAQDFRSEPALPSERAPLKAQTP